MKKSKKVPTPTFEEITLVICRIGDERMIKFHKKGDKKL